jgi:hypothetical protein
MNDIRRDDKDSQIFHFGSINNSFSSLYSDKSENKIENNYNNIEIEQFEKGNNNNNRINLNKNKSICTKPSFLIILILLISLITIYKFHSRTKTLESKLKILTSEKLRIENINKELDLSLNKIEQNQKETLSKLESAEKKLKKIEKEYNSLFPKETLISNNIQINTISIPLMSSIIKDYFEYLKILDMISPGSILTMHLIYKTMFHGDDLSTFKKRANRHERTLILIETNDNKRFGGYSTKDWGIFRELLSNFIDINSFQEDKNSFLFSLDNYKKYSVRDTSKAIYSDNKHVLVFGDGDIIIKDNYLVKKSESFFPKTYGNSGVDKVNDLCGDNSFIVKNIEMFAVHKLR